MRSEELGVKNLNIDNLFCAPVYFFETVGSTMDVSKQLASEGAAQNAAKLPAQSAAELPVHGTVIVADFQEAGRGRGQKRTWEMEKGLNLSFTILLRFPSVEDIPPAFTLRTGLSVSLAIEDAVPSLKNKVKVKWPNDILIGDKKVCGILCEADGGSVHAGIGVNVLQKEFPSHLRDKATSIFLEAESGELGVRSEELGVRSEECGVWSVELGVRGFLLERILSRLYDELENENNDWKERLEKRLYKMGEQVTFMEGKVDSKNIINGLLIGISKDGELLITPEGETAPKTFITGELKIDN